jgi:hypothetical protein
MVNWSHEPFTDELVGLEERDSLPPGFFDRFVFNLHQTDAAAPSVILGLGLYPAKDIVDGFAMISTATEQRNVRYSTRLSAAGSGACGPFRYEVLEPNRVWRLSLAANPTGMVLDLQWEARTPAWWGEVAVTNPSGELTSFAHLFQSGWVSGTLTLDGTQTRVDRWYSQRDRSRGVRTLSGGQGLHIWYQAQFPDRSVGFMLVESRDGGRILLEGAVMHADGALDEIVDVGHDLHFDDLDLRSGMVVVTAASGTTYRIGTDASAGGGFMAGGGYDGHHGTDLGTDHLESDVYPLDGSVTQRSFSTSLTDRLCTFDWDGVRGSGIFEFAMTRSTSYTYRPTLPPAG